MTQERQKQIDKLLQIAKVPSEKQVKARQDLEYRLRLAQHMSTLALQRKNPKDHNSYFDGIEKAVTSLIKGIKRLETNGPAEADFWFSSAFEPEPIFKGTRKSSVEQVASIESARKANVDQVLTTLEKILLASREGRYNRMGRPGAIWKQRLVYYAHELFESMKAPEMRASEYAPGPFYLFVKLFCETAMGEDVGTITLQIRRALKRHSQQK